MQCVANLKSGLRTEETLSPATLSIHRPAGPRAANLEQEAAGRRRRRRWRRGSTRRPRASVVGQGRPGCHLLARAHGPFAQTCSLLQMTGRAPLERSPASSAGGHSPPSPSTAAASRRQRPASSMAPLGSPRAARRLRTTTNGPSPGPWESRPIWTASVASDGWQAPRGGRYLKYRPPPVGIWSAAAW